MPFRVYAANRQNSALEPTSFDPGPLKPDDVDIQVTHCGICHSDLAMLENEWGMSKYPVVPGHEVIGTVAALGSNVSHLKPGQRVGLGWYSATCRHCEWCESGEHALCQTAESTIINRFGGFADRVRCSAYCAVPIPEGLDSENAAPLLCAGITVFNPFVKFNFSPMARVGVVGIGGLGHLALQFARAWGCRVVAFTSTGAKADEAKKFGAEEIINSRDPKDLDAAAGSLDVILNTVGAAIDWQRYVNALRPKGTLVVLGASTTNLEVSPFSLIMARRSIAGNPSGGPGDIARMLQFAKHHGIKAQTERFPMTRVNEALAHLKADKARYRIVLDASA
ncbi:MAG TPA: NAD(P)-dependent alcohol dehydrogenase [Phycisphaerales bacterium]|nr:NAD(P)-dependent alcohol dehydrogenase [Phycisphaerales bacterium]